MSSRGKSKVCRVCGGDLHGNQRRWLFGGQNKKAGQAQTPTDSLGRGSLSTFSESSPWGSTMSLASTMSLPSLSSPPKAMDLLSVLTHILGRSVPRGGGRGEFLCGKCVSILERVFKFDTVISRMRVLSSERLQKLTGERDKVRHWIRSAYFQQHPLDLQLRCSTSEEDTEGADDREGYREMLKENMALSEYECWSEKSAACPYFSRTGKRCKRGKACEGCDSLRVSDSAFESVCGVPRHLPFQAFSPLALSRNKSQSMPLHWSKVPSLSSTPSSLAASALSLRGRSRTGSVQSLDMQGGHDPFDCPEDLSVNLVLRELKGIEGKPVISPSGSKIPVLGKREGRHFGDVGLVSSSEVSRVLDFGDRESAENGGEEMDDETSDVLTELKDEFIPLHRENAAGRVHIAVRQLRGQLDRAEARIKDLEAELKKGSKTKPETADGSRLNEWTMGLNDMCSAMSDKDKRMETEMETLRRASRDRERDVNTLNIVIQSNTDIINEMRVELVEKERMQQEVLAERDVWRQRDQALTAALQEKDAMLLCLNEALESCQKDMQALWDSVISQGVSGGGADGALANQLKEKEILLTAMLKDKEKHSTAMCLEVSKLNTALHDLQAVMQEQRQKHGQTVSSLSQQLKDTQNHLRERGKESKEAEWARLNDKQDREREERKLRESLEKRDRLIEQVLQQSEERDYQLKELRQNLLNKSEPMTAVKHTL
ncbi:hypothetical protein DPEC_G00351490 [Dallia pectoralis]|uniref:Uncharacterized protein n=1 Tax=Dallia pectoralis TaxID=75939 RepID=A0ACC2F226_DALPE|nr:hypothetical protein DPEC_G00351490 [Dallia pectoralis]